MQKPAPSERDRLARLGAGCDLLVFGFWTGKLPDLSRLHFLTVARALPPRSRYVLFTHKATIPAPMSALLDANDIKVVQLRLPRLMREVGAAKLLRRTPLSGWWPALERIAARPGFARRMQWSGHPSEIHGFTPRANFLLGGPPAGRVIVSNYARVLISAIVPEHTLYCDLDFAFTRPLDWIFQHSSFVYRWDRKPYANNALMSVAPGSPVKQGELLRLLLREGSGRSWVLYTNRNCEQCGLEIIPCDRLDPLWSKTGPRGPRYRDFFRSSEHAAADLAFLKDRFDAIHWHNQWQAMPDPGSPYSLWLNELQNAAEPGSGQDRPLLPA